MRHESGNMDAPIRCLSTARSGPVLVVIWLATMGQHFGCSPQYHRSDLRPEPIAQQRIGDAPARPFVATYHEILRGCSWMGVAGCLLRQPVGNFKFVGRVCYRDGHPVMLDLAQGKLGRREAVGLLRRHRAVLVVRVGWLGTDRAVVEAMAHLAVPRIGLIFSLDGTRGETDREKLKAALSRLVGLSAEKVAALSIDRGVDDEILAVIARFLSLEYLEIGRSYVSDPGLERIAHLPGLRELKLGPSDVTDDGVRRLSSLPALRRLSFWDTLVSNPARALGPSSPVKSLALVGGLVRDIDLRDLPKLRKLSRLSLQSRYIGDTGARYVGQCSNVRELDLSGTKVTDRALEMLRRLGKLEVLRLNYTGVTDRGLRHLLELRGLHVLELGGTRVSGQALERLGQLGRLQALRWSRPSSSDTPRLRTLGRLKWLDLSMQKLSVEGFHELQALRRLKYLGLAEADFRDDWLRLLGVFRTLRCLDLSSTKISVEGLRWIVELPGLKSLNLAWTSLDDRALDLLSRARGLRGLDLRGTEVSRKGLDAFRRRHPACHVWR